MPFQPEWDDYKEGDLIFGLSEERVNFGRYLKIDDINDHKTIDTYDTFSINRGYAHLKYDPSFIESLAAHQKYHNVLNYDLEPDNDNWKEQHTKTAAHARRKCKGAMNWITSTTTKQVHFLLRGINLKEVPSKTFIHETIKYCDDPQGKAPANMGWMDKSRSITGSELRWIYRNRINSRVQQQIQFWESTASKFFFNQCCPPWDDQNQPSDILAAWAMYNP